MNWKKKLDNGNRATAESLWLTCVVVLFWVVVLLLSTCLSGCRSSRNASTSVTKDSTEVVKDTIVSVPEESDTFTFSFPLVSDTTIVKQKENNKRASLRLTRKSANVVQAICQEEAYKLKLDSVIRLKNVTQVIKKTVTVERCTSVVHKIAVGFMFGVVAVLLILLFVKK